MTEIEENEAKGKELFRRGEFIKSIEYHKKALSLKGKYLGIKNLHTASSYNSLALVYTALEEYEEALALREKSLEIVIELLGEEHEDTATNYYNLASLYYYMNDMDNALDFHEKALKMRMKLLGLEHIHTAYSCAGMARVCLELERIEGALMFFEKALEIANKEFNQEDIFIANIYDDLGRLYTITEEYDKVINMYKDALEMKIRIFGENHLQVAMTSFYLTSFYFNIKKDYIKAYEYIKKCVNIRKEFLPKGHTDLVEAIEALEIIQNIETNKKSVQKNILIGKVSDLLKNKKLPNKPITSNSKSLENFALEKGLSKKHFNDLSDNDQQLLVYDIGFLTDNSFRYYIFELILLVLKKENVFSDDAFIQELFFSSYNEMKLLEFNEEEQEVVVDFFKIILNEINEVIGDREQYNKLEQWEKEEVYHPFKDWEDEIIKNLHLWRKRFERA